MPIRLVCSNGENEAADGVADLIATHHEKVAMVERLGKRLMAAEGMDTTVIGRRLDAVMAEESASRRRVAATPVSNVAEIKMKAAYFQRLMDHGWCEVDADDLHELLRSFTRLQA
ncbi:hypothetical protein [Mesorhizobium sp. A623]